MANGNVNWIAGVIWNIADDVLLDSRYGYPISIRADQNNFSSVKELG